MAGVAEEEPLENQDRGTLLYQESKQFHGEWFLCNAYDNIKAKRVTFEIYGMDTQDKFQMGYDYAKFDDLFRFNAELMNPNRKEGRYHWVVERLGVQTFSKERDDRVLKLMPEPTREVPELPIYETTRKIPTGRMDLQERQRLRDQMDMLDIRRVENISKKRMATKQRVLHHIRRLQEDDKRLKESVNQKIEAERKNRWEFRAEQESREREAESRIEAMRKLRRKAVQGKERRTEEQDEADYKQLRARWRVRDAERAKIKSDTHAKQEKDLEQRREAEEQEKDEADEVQGRRETAWKMREERVRRKEDAKLKEIDDEKQDRLRIQKLQKERNAEYLQILHERRQPIFEEQMERTEERRLEKEAESEALANYQEKRAIPKKVKTKGKFAPRKPSKDETVAVPKAKAKGKAAAGKTAKKGEEAASEAEPEEPSGKVDTEKVLDAVEAKMRKEMEDQRRREELEELRDEKMQEAQKAREQKENLHNKEIREAFRKKSLATDELAAERRLIMFERNREHEAAEDRKKADRARLEKVREQNMARREEQRLLKLSQG